MCFYLIAIGYLRKMRVKGFSFSLLLLSFLGNVFISSNTKATITHSSLTVSIDGLKNQKGQICFSLFASSRGFPNSGERALQANCVKVANAPIQITFNNLQAGSYAVAVIHDVNSDRTLNRNFLGIPTEGFGFSQNPIIQTGPPKFIDSVIIVSGQNTNIEIKLQYFLAS